MAGYSGTPLPKKLGIKEGSRVVLVAAPEGIEAELEPLPDGVRVNRRLVKDVDVALLFVTARRDLEQQFNRVAQALQPAGGLWVAWPKKASGMPTDLDQQQVMDVGLATGMVDNKVCAIDEIWSGLRFVYRLKDRPPATERAQE